MIAMSMVSIIFEAISLTKISILLILGLLSGLFFGITNQKLNGPQFGIKPFIFFSLLINILSSLLHQAGLKADILIEPSLLLTGLLVSVAIWLSAFYIKAGKNIELSEIIFMLLCMSTSILIGIELLSIAVIMIILISLITYIYVYFFPIESRKKLYIARIEIKQLSIIESIENMLQNFDIVIVEKQFNQKKNLVIILKYKTSPIIQHLLVEKLLTTKGVGSIVFL